MGRVRQREGEVEEALFRFYASALSQYTRFQALLLLAYVTRCGRRHEAHALRSRGLTVREIADGFGVSERAVFKTLRAPLPPLPGWAKEALEELRDYGVDEVVEELCEPWRAA